MICWHYTAGAYLPAILRSRVLRPSRPVIVNGEVMEHPAVWFSLRPDFDPAARLGVVTTRPRTVSWGQHGGMVRIGVAPETAPLTLADFVALGGVHPKAKYLNPRWLESLPAQGSDPDDWRVSLEPVPASKWLRIEWRSGIHSGERWEAVG